MSVLRILLPLAATAFLACTSNASGSSGTPEDGDWSSRMQVRVEAAPGENALRVIFEGVPGWYMNTAYPGIRVSLEAPSGVTFEKAQLGRDEVRYEEESDEDKALRAVFTVPVTMAGEPGGPLQGDYRAVVCTDEICSPPFTGTFSLPVPTPGS
jgi:hypothetical protein